jgi:hypothetical protein
MTFDERKQECINKGIVPGAQVRCALDPDDIYVVQGFDMWEIVKATGAIHDGNGCALYSGSLDRYADVITAAHDDEVTRLRNENAALQSAAQVAADALDAMREELNSIANAGAWPSNEIRPHLNGCDTALSALRALGVMPKGGG